MSDSSLAGPSMLQEQGQGDAPMPGLSSNPSFSKAGGPFHAPLLDGLASTYNPASHNEWPQGNQSLAGYPSSCLKQDALSMPHQEPGLSLQTSASSIIQSAFRTDKNMDFSPAKQDQKGAGGSGLGKHQPPPQSGYLPATPSQAASAQKLSLDKYREKHAGELTASGQKRSQEQYGEPADCDARGDMSSSTYAPSFTSQVDHRKHSQSHQTSHSGGGGSTTASPMKIKAPSSSSSTSGQDRRHHGDKRDKGLLKLRLPVPGPGGDRPSSSQLDKSGGVSKDELKMKIKVSSSERHGPSDEGVAANNNNNKSKHSSPLLSKEKQHRGGDHNLHRHHKHSHSHPHMHSGNGRGGPEGPGGLLRPPPGLLNMEGSALAPPGSASLSSSSARKRVHPEGSHNHHPSSSFSSSCSKVSKIPKGGTGAAGTTSSSFPLLPPRSSPVLQCVSSGLQLYG